MTRTLRSIMRSRQGEAYLYLCVLVLIVSTLTSVLVLYMGLTAQIRIQRQEVQKKLDSCLSAYAIDAFDALKQGDNCLHVLDTQALENAAYNSMGFSAGVSSLACGNGNCTMSRPTVTVLTGNGYGITATYSVYYPIEWNGRSFTGLTVPITVTSYYKIK